MFESLKNIDTAFKYVRLLTGLTIACSFALCIAIAYFYQSQKSKNEQKVYVIANGKIFDAFADVRDRYYPIEIQDHVEVFHRYFYTISPSDKNLEKSVNRALFLADQSAANEYNNLREAGYYSSMTSANAFQEVEADSITVDLNSSPWRFRYFGKLRITRPTSTTTRSIISEGAIRKVLPSRENPHGLLIERWRVTENNTIDQENR
ncbi:conjugative transposon protein TraK [Paraflavitalea sp. CAU 1676]|uniref:conjugative transposon protein TraK n=1 Tax=Paraflavitalea sp. CAU 1676 TaxID=3032598 RepID=UPI0023DB4436|nr:conjugative transposon protein TraK [Paraflavitalea sp. CAU 1676]MDF2191371.1 conjugative transposon protein TraK [Paraflavitalea sp. CAU 1676]